VAQCGTGIDLAAVRPRDSVALHPHTAGTVHGSAGVSCSVNKEKVARTVPYVIIERRVPRSFGSSQPAGDASHNPGGRVPLLSARPTVTPATLKRGATNFAAW